MNVHTRQINEIKLCREFILYTLYNVILRIARNLPETRETIKIESHTFHGLVLGLVGLIDAEAIDVAQPIWLRDCPS